MMLAFCVYARLGHAQYLKVGDKFPDVSFTIQTGDSVKRNVRLSDFKGKLVIFDFWSTHCPPCINQMADMLKLQE